MKNSLSHPNLNCMDFSRKVFDKAVKGFVSKDEINKLYRESLREHVENIPSIDHLIETYYNFLKDKEKMIDFVIQVEDLVDRSVCSQKKLVC